MPIAGSSPRVRGTPMLFIWGARLIRFIPAGAGNTNKLIMQSPPITVHPRGCGEHITQSADKLAKAGSSPRVRGTQCLCSLKKCRIRFIPAGAGNTYRQWIWFTGLCGSSPRVRGTREPLSDDELNERFIPAGAGNTFFCLFWLCYGAVHPRGCGEHLGGFWLHMAITGSSPRVRGTPALIQFPNLSRRFIPAGAGNTKKLKATKWA